MIPLPSKNKAAKGGEVEPSDDEDSENLMNHVALEAMKAIESKDKEGFISALHVLMGDFMSKMQSEPDGDE